jgi:hypothetical protein
MIEYKECSLIYREENKNENSILAMRDYKHIIFNSKYVHANNKKILGINSKHQEQKCFKHRFFSSVFNNNILIIAKDLNCCSFKYQLC